MRYEVAGPDDCARLAEWNRRLIEDEGHRNEMTVPELEDRMRGWISDGYTAITFHEGADPVAYALYRETGDEVYLRQFFVRRDRRREGIGRRAMESLIEEVWPSGKRLTVEVLWDNEAAWAFWNANGYTEYAVTLERRPPGDG